MMEENEVPAKETAHNGAKSALTPHELYNYHILHPDEPITDEDIRNLKIDTGAVFQEHQLTQDEAIETTVSQKESKHPKETEEDNTISGDERSKESPYDILGGS